MLTRQSRGFTLIELVSVVVLVGILSVVLFSRLGGVHTANIQSSRDDVIAALFFAQQQAMMRSTGNNIRVVLTTNSVSVTEDGAAINLGGSYYPLALPSGITASSATFSYDKLGRTTAGTITLSGSGGVSASIRVEASGYAFAN